MATKAGCPELRKLLRRYPVSIEATSGGHYVLCTPEGQPLRLPDGRRVTISNSPRSGSGAAIMVAKQLRALGIEAR